MSRREPRPGRRVRGDRGPAIPAIPATDGSPARRSGGAMPGWDIVADLTPPELIATRRLRKVRLLVATMVVLAAAATGAGYVHAQDLSQEAAAEVADAESVTAALRQQQHAFAQVTSLQAGIAAARQQTAELMGSDVDVDTLLGRIWAALPPGAQLTQVTVSVPSSHGGAGTAVRSGAAALDTSDAGHIGSMTLTGSGTELDDTAAFIDGLAAIDGIFGPFPTSNVRDGNDGTAFTVQLTVTDAALSGYFDIDGGEG